MRFLRQEGKGKGKLHEMTLVLILRGTATETCLHSTGRKGTFQTSKGRDRISGAPLEVIRSWREWER